MMSAISEKPVVLDRNKIEDPLRSIPSFKNAGSTHHASIKDGLLNSFQDSSIQNVSTEGSSIQDSSIQDSFIQDSSLRILFAGHPENMRSLKKLVKDGDRETEIIEFLPEKETEKERQSDKNILLIDISAGSKSGIEAFRNYGEYTNLPIVILTDIQNENLARRAVQAGAQDYIIYDRIDRFLFTRILRNAIERNRIICSLEKTRKLERYLAYHDPLTRLPNRALFFDRLVQSVAQAKRTGKSMAVFFLDLDGFKKVNDTLGHSAGDLLLITTAERITQCIRESETASRLGGDEFGIILSEISHERDAAIVADRILETVVEPVQLADREYHVKTSIGIGLFPSDGNDPKSLVKNADTAMYRAKAEGGQMYRFFTPDINTDLILHPVHEMNIRKALEKDEFTLFFQPQIDLFSGDTVSVESLVRWNHPDIGIIPPDQFIPAAEKSGIIDKLGEFVLRKTCFHAARWQSARPVRVAVNISVCQIQRPEFIKTVSSAIESTGLKPQLLTLEISESSALNRSEDLIDKIRTVKSMGIQLAIDDFGTGYATLSYLKYVPADLLKIDSSFLSNITTNAEDTAIVKAIIAMAHSLTLRVVAEGVENEAQLAMLRHLGCDMAQGYYFSKPLPENELKHFLSK